MPRVGQDFPQVQPRADIVPAVAAVVPTRLDDARVRNAGHRVTRHIHDAAAPE